MDPEFAGILSARSRLAEYEVERVLGRPGGFGITYLATDTHLAKQVAIKEYLPTEFAVRGHDSSVTVRSQDDREAFSWGLKSFLNEARVLARFSHPNVVQVYRFFEAHGTAYIVMEYVQGETLLEILKREGTLDESRLKSVLLPIADGLEVMHKAGVLHRDIKPENIIIRPDGQPVLIDFGAARNALGTKSKSILSVLTPGYAPIEQYSEVSAQGPWTDIYALGAVAYRMINGKRPVDSISRINRDSLVPAVMAGAGRYSASLLQAVDRALSMKAEDRPQSIAQWRDELEGEPEATRSMPPTPIPDAAPADAAGRLTESPAPTRASQTRQAEPSQRSEPAQPRRWSRYAGAFIAAALLLAAGYPFLTGRSLLPEQIELAMFEIVDKIGKVADGRADPEQKLPQSPAPKPAESPVDAPATAAGEAPQPTDQAIAGNPPDDASSSPAPELSPAPETGDAGEQPAEPPPATATTESAPEPAPAAEPPKGPDMATAPAAPPASGAAPRTKQSQKSKPIAKAPPAVGQAPDKNSRADLAYMPGTTSDSGSVIRRRPAESTAPSARSAAQPQTAQELWTRLQGKWAGTVGYETPAPGSSCQLAVKRAWTLNFTKLRPSNQGIEGELVASFDADGVRGKGCSRAEHSEKHVGSFVVTTFILNTSAESQIVLEPRGLQCQGDCNQTSGLFNRSAVGQGHRMIISRQGDQVSFSDQGVRFNLRRSR
jgi:serine/threonine protein kinase